MKRVSTDSNVNGTVKELLSKGWCIRPGKKHKVLLSPTGRKLAIPSTPSDRRAHLNFKSSVNKLEPKGVVT